VTGMEAYYPMAVSDNYSMIIDNSSRANHASITKAEIRSRFFSDTCTNGPDGTTSCPYPTIRGALDDAQPGDHIYIREGRYSELLTKWQLNHSNERVAYHMATEGPKIVIEGYPNEEVILDGTVASDPANEKFQSLEAGANYSSGIFNVKTSYYNTDWIDRNLTKAVTSGQGSSGDTDVIFLSGINQNHSGIEVEASAQLMSMLRLDAIVSLGN